MLHDDSCFALTSTDEGVTKYLSVGDNNGGYISATSSRIPENEILQYIQNMIQPKIIAFI